MDCREVRPRAQSRRLALGRAGDGFDSPYDVDQAGRRAEFQRRLFQEKIAWESTHPSFVTDRTTLDNLVYTMFHDVHSITQEDFAEISTHRLRYTHIFYCPVSAFCKTGGDPSRVNDMTYQVLYDRALRGFLHCTPAVLTLHEVEVVNRQAAVQRAIGA